MTDKPSIILIGTGAVGSFYGGKLAQAGARVVTVSRSDYEAVKKKGININSIYGDFLFKPERVLRNISEYNEVPDYIIVATKVLPQINVPELIQKGVQPQTSIVLLQNGVGIEDSVIRAFPENEIINGLAFICVSRREYAVIDHQDFGRIVIGKHPNGTSEKVEILAELFTRAGVPCEIDPDIATARWKKLIWNAPFNPISVLGGADTMSMMDTPASFHLVCAVMKEVQATARSLGHEIPDSFIQKNLDDTAVMKPYKTSMLLDFESKRQMEVEAILGNAIRIAEKNNVAVPHMESLYALLTLQNENFK